VLQKNNPTVNVPWFKIAEAERQEKILTGTYEGQPPETIIFLSESHTRGDNLGRPEPPDD